MEKERMMQLHYDKEGDVLYISLGEPRPATSHELGDDVLLRVDAETGAVVGLTVFNLSTRDTGDVLPIAVEIREL